LQQTILKELEKYNLTPLQASIYVSMIKLGTSSATKIAYESKVGRSEVYRVIPTLQKLGLIDVYLNKPLKFTPTPPEKALSNLLLNMKSDLLDTEKGRKKLVLKLESIKNKKEPEPEGLKVILGLKKAHQKIVEMISNAQKEVSYATSAKGLVLESEAGILGTLKNAAKRDVRIKFITEIDRTNLKIARRLKNFCELKHFPQLNVHIIIVDNKEMQIGLVVEISKKQSRSNINLWINNKAFIDFMMHSFNGFWQESSPPSNI
jgi:sugar-specific transcriptional regulator TrmB